MATTLYLPPPLPTGITIPAKNSNASAPSHIAAIGPRVSPISSKPDLFDVLVINVHTGVHGFACVNKGRGRPPKSRDTRTFNSEDLRIIMRDISAPNANPWYCRTSPLSPVSLGDIYFSPSAQATPIPRYTNINYDVTIYYAKGPNVPRVVTDPIRPWWRPIPVIPDPLPNGDQPFASQRALELVNRAIPLPVKQTVAPPPPRLVQSGIGDPALNGVAPKLVLIASAGNKMKSPTLAVSVSASPGGSGSGNVSTVTTTTKTTESLVTTTTTSSTIAAEEAAAQQEQQQQPIPQKKRKRCDDEEEEANVDTLAFVERLLADSPSAPTVLATQSMRGGVVVHNDNNKEGHLTLPPPPPVDVVVTAAAKHPSIPLGASSGAVDVTDIVTLSPAMRPPPAKRPKRREAVEIIKNVEAKMLEMRTFVYQMRLQLKEHCLDEECDQVGTCGCPIPNCPARFCTPHFIQPNGILQAHIKDVHTRPKEDVAVASSPEKANAPALAAIAKKPNTLAVSK